MMRTVVAPLLALAFAFANVGPTVCAAVHAHGRAPVERGLHSAHASHAAPSTPSTGGAWVPVPDPGHHVACPGPAHCGVTLVGAAQGGVFVTVGPRPVSAPPHSPVDGAARPSSDPATPPPKA